MLSSAQLEAIAQSVAASGGDLAATPLAIYTGYAQAPYFPLRLEKIIVTAVVVQAWQAFVNGVYAGISYETSHTHGYLTQTLQVCCVMCARVA